jgi:nitrate reductase delta subunit
MSRFRALAALLAYPEEELIGNIRAIRILFPAAGEIQMLLDEFESGSLHVLQERYVELFDRSRALSLHLFEHVHGESRDRGQAMVDLAATYASRGFTVAGNELPDYLPAFLEFLSVLPEGEAKGMLTETAHILRSLGDRLAERGSRYCAVFAHLLRACGEPGLTKKLAPRAEANEDLAALDKAWMEEPVTFMGGPAPAAVPVKFYAKGQRP